MDPPKPWTAGSSGPKVVTVNHVKGGSSTTAGNINEQKTHVVDPWGGGTGGIGSSEQGGSEQRSSDSRGDRGSFDDIRGNKERSQRGTSNAFASAYTLAKQLGSGASGTVWLCHKKAGGGTFAAKVIDLRPFKLRERFSMARVRREVDVMRRLRHPNIIALFEVFESEEQLILVLEYVPGVELFDAILAKKHYTEDEARPVFVQVARAIQYMHSMGIVHRDIKPENVLVEDKPTQDGLYPQAKLLDFGLSKVVGDDAGSVAKTFVGTPCYLAPEVELRSRGQGSAYGTEVDCWSLGAVLFVMLAARFPEFHTERVGGGPGGASVQQVRTHVKMVGAVWDTVSEEAKDLIRGLMRFVPQQRMTATQALQHPWVTGLAYDARPPTPAEVAAAAWQTSPQAGPLVVASQQHPVTGAGPTAAAAPGAKTSGYFGQPVIQEILTPPAPASTAGRKVWQSGSQTSASSAGCGGGRANAMSWDTADAATSGSGGGSGRQQAASVSGNGGLAGTDNAGDVIRACGASPSSYTGMVVEEVEEEPHPSLKRSASDEARDAAGSAASEAAQQTHRQPAPAAAGGTATSGPFSPGAGNGDPATPVPPWLAPQQQRLLLLAAPSAVSAAQDTTAVAAYNEGQNLNLAPLLFLHNSISSCLETAVESYREAPQAASSLRRSALLCRENLVGSMKLLRKIEQTATQVLDLFPDLWLAVEEKEPALASEFFSTVRTWVGDLYKAVTEVQERNASNTLEINDLMGEAVQDQRQAYARTSRNLSGDLRVDSLKKGDLISVDPALFEIVRRMRDAKSAESAAAGGSGSGGGISVSDSEAAQLTEEQILDLFLAMAKPASTGGKAMAENKGDEVRGSREESSQLHGISSTGSVASERSDASQDGGAAAANSAEAKGAHMPTGCGDKDRGGVDATHLSRNMSLDDAAPPPAGAVPQAGAAGASNSSPNKVGHLQPPPLPSQPPPASRAISGPFPSGGGGRAREDIGKALRLLHEVDSVLEQLALFWANTEVIFDVLLRKGDLVEKFVAFADKPRLLNRFQERMVEYRRFWEGIKVLSSQYICGQGTCRAYKFLDAAGVTAVGAAQERGAATSPPGGTGSGGSNEGGGVIRSL